MSGLVKATLQRLKSDESGDTDGDEIPVQFNPASLKLTLSNSTEGGQSRGRQARQSMGNSATELAFELVFDSADEHDGSNGPRSVREKTGQVEQFVLPQGAPGASQPPPKVRFHWKEIIVDGVISSLAIDFDHFAKDGTPLRAKMQVSIKEQNSKYELKPPADPAPPPPGGAAAGAPGTDGSPATNQSAAALEGESAADFAARMGLDPGAWRGLAAGLDGTLSLAAGLEIDFDASLSLSAGIGFSAGFEADLSVSLEASLGLDVSLGASASVGISAGASATASSSASASSAGFAMAGVGGVAAAIDSVAIARATAATAATQRSFGASAGAPASASASPVRTAAASGAVSGVALGRASSPASRSTASGASTAALPASSSATTSTSVAVATTSASSAVSRVAATAAIARVDPRAASFGYGVPLRPRVEGAAGTTLGTVSLRPYARPSEAPVADRPNTPPWERLPAASSAGGLRKPAALPAKSGGSGKAKGGCGCGCAGKKKGGHG